MKTWDLLILSLSLLIAPFYLLPCQEVTPPEYKLAITIAQEDQVDLLALLVDGGFELNSSYRETKGFTVLHVAAQYGSLEVIEYAVGKGASIEQRNDNGANALELAVAFKQYSAAEKLLELGANINSRDTWHRTPLFKATISNRIDMVLFLIEHGAEIDTVQYDGENALHLLLSKPDPDIKIIQAYLENGYDPEKEDEYQYNLLHYMSMQDNVEIIKLLEPYNVDYNEPIEGGFSPFCIALISGNLNTAMYLYSKGVNINQKDDNGRSAVFYAVRNQDVSGLKFILKLNPDLSIIDNDGKSPRDYANNEIRAILDRKK